LTISGSAGYNLDVPDVFDAGRSLGATHQPAGPAASLRLVRLAAPQFITLIRSMDIPTV